jgi:hypothetical protein
MCNALQTLTFPASLEVIGKGAFADCLFLRNLSFASESKLPRINKAAFGRVALKTVILPATLGKIDPSAFAPKVWRLVQFDGPPPLLINADFLCSADSHILLRTLSSVETVLIPAGIEVIGPGSCSRSRWITEIVFESGTRLKEIGQAAFAECGQLRVFIVPSSVETIGDRCFEDCHNMTTITFGDSARLKRIGERAFAKSQLTSITIPASTEEIAGSAFVGCPILKIEIAAESRKFIVEGSLFLTSNGTEIVRFFGRELEIAIHAKVEILRKSCFEGCDHVEKIQFENGSKLLRISRSALSDCSSLRSMSIPAYVEVIEEKALKRCTGLESCLISEKAGLVEIEAEAFSECCSLRSFCIPGRVQVIGKNCFNKCGSLYRLMFESGESLNKFVGSSTLNDALETVVLGDLSSVLIIALEHAGIPFEFSGWSSVVDSNSGLTLVQDIA